MDVILLCTWIVLHSPEIRWDSCEVTRWSEYCHQHCLSVLPKLLGRSLTAQIASTSIESPASLETPSIPPDYAAFQDVFSKQAATHLQHHQPWDCAIDLLPGAKLPKGQVYPLSIPEHKAMEDYIQEALNQGFIRPYTSPVESSFFFVGKKDWGLRPCIDYRVLNSQTVKLQYPLPLVPAVLEEPCGNFVLTTSFVSGRATNGRRLLSPLLATMSISLCRSAFQRIYERGVLGVPPPVNR